MRCERAALVSLLACCWSVGTAESALAGYKRTGPATAVECSDYVLVLSCHEHHIDAVRGLDGKFYTFRDYCEGVDEHSEKSGVCRVRVRSAWLDSHVRQALLEHQPDGSYSRVTPSEFITFRCVPTTAEPAWSRAPAAAP